jgi:hypothetical protein
MVLLKFEKVRTKTSIQFLCEFDKKQEQSELVKLCQTPDFTKELIDLGFLDKNGVTQTPFRFKVTCFQNPSKSWTYTFYYFDPYLTTSHTIN